VFECKFDSDAYSACQSPYQLNSLAEEAHIFMVRARDLAGNYDPVPPSYSWSTDSIPPDTVINSAPANLTNQTSGSFSFSSNEADTTFQCSMDGSLFSDCLSPYNFSVLAIGTHSFQVRTRDLAGNIDQTPAAYPWTINGPSNYTAVTIGGTTSTYATLSEAIAAISAGISAEIKIQGMDYSGSITINAANAVVTLAGGYNSGLIGVNGETVIIGKLTIRNGKLIAKNIKVRPTY
jgi:hypothetical protein